MKLTPCDIFCSPDLIVAILLFILLLILLPSNITCAFSIGIYEVGISVLSIIFSLFLASSAIIISSSDDDFILFIEVEDVEKGEKDKKEGLGAFSTLISASLFTLCALLIALIYSITAFTLTSHSLSVTKTSTQSKWVFLIFVFLFSYSLLSTTLAVIQSFMYAKKRVEYLRIKKGREDRNKGN